MHWDFREAPKKSSVEGIWALPVRGGGGGVSTLARMVWGNFFGKNLLDFGGVQTLAWMVWGTFFGDEVPQSESARLSGGWGVGAIVIWAMPKCLR